jgi:hypothetical protein
LKVWAKILISEVPVVITASINKLKNNETYYYDDCRCRIVFLKGRLEVDIVIWHLFLRPID